LLGIEAAARILQAFAAFSKSSGNEGSGFQLAAFHSSVLWDEDSLSLPNLAKFYPYHSVGVGLWAGTCKPVALR
jgi:hypothetical protein